MAVQNFRDITQNYTESSIDLFVKGNWVHVSSDHEKLPLATYEETAQQIISDSAASTKKELEASIPFVSQFNRFWTEARLARREFRSVKKGEDPIQFSSTSRQFSWLSNFFQTIIVDVQNNRVLPHLEAGYVAFKIDNLQGSGEASATAASQIFDPKVCKRYGSGYVRTSPIENKASVAEVMRLAHLKFRQNPVLEQMLISSGDAKLEEHTADTFWGTANGTYYVKSSNLLGQILTRVRTAFQPTI